ncbi:Nicotinamidase-related amidase [Reichenbachiella faecimaris]|uniref:Nicotinamidase-related amidase n=1 Tax=Reichenbachiella faecimaris TaxID=692418 RepID=A0A1W2G931_REIFA|nr:cysteine hydrolase family protein [Reichenbachiella faecimaris]SMD32952.1 Nicotinamidase-related amidase [Reichenbachiella faecimaris]
MTNKALLLIDIQNGLDEVEFYGGQRNNPNAEANCSKILNLFRENKWPIFHVRHNSTNPESPLHPSKSGNQIKSMVAPIDDEPVIEKNVNSAFVGTNLKGLLDVEQIDQLIIVGLTTEHCVSTSARMAANLGYQVTVVSDATAAFNKVGIAGERYEAEVIHLTTLATLQGEFAEIMDTQTVLDELSI